MNGLLFLKVTGRTEHKKEHQMGEGRGIDFKKRSKEREEKKKKRVERTPTLNKK